MGNRRHAGGAGARSRLGGCLFFVVTLGISLAAGLWVEARDRHGAHPLDYHATVLNGRIVGSAFSIGNGIVVTNGHVLRGLAPGAPVAVVASSGGARTTGRVVAVSPRMDLGLLAVEDGTLPAIGREDGGAAAGSAVVAAGVDAAGRAWPVPRLEVRGDVLVERVRIPAFGSGLIARLPGVRPGFSGGPLFDVQGRLVGMVTAIRPGGGRGAVPTSGFAPGGAGQVAAEEAFVLRASDIRAEVRRLLRGL